MDGFALSTGSVEITLNSDGIRERLKSDGVANDIERRAQAVAAAARERYARIAVGPREAGEGPGPHHIPVEVHMGEGPTRARARIVADHPAALVVEMKHRVLGQSIDAARDA
jgi:hypothetical protein